jgi:hypothetical protein
MNSTNTTKPAELQQTRRQSAEQALATHPLTASEALDATHRFLSQWTRQKTPEYFDWVAEVFQLYPAAIIRELMHPTRGIGRTPAPKGGPRLYPPEISEITDWCEARCAEYTRAANPPPPSPAPPPPPSAEDVARVQAKLKEAKVSLTRAMGGKDKLTEAQQILERCEREAKEAALAAVKARQSPPSDGAHAARAYADLGSRRRGPFDDPDMMAPPVAEEPDVSETEAERAAP